MAAGGGGGSCDVSRAQQQPGTTGVQRRGRHPQKAAWLPLDVIAEIAARSDAATLVRCAATCRDARRRIAEDPSLLGRLRLRDTERFVLPLLRGHLAGIPIPYTGGEKTDVYMVDTTTTADAARLVNVTRVVRAATFAEADETPRNVSMDSRGGLVLVRATWNTHHQRPLLVVCNLATRRSLALPPEPAFPYNDADWSSTRGVQYVLLVGGADDDEGGAAAAATVGRPFQVVMSKLVLSQYRSYRRLLVHTFSSEHGAWSQLVEIPTPSLDGSSGIRYQRPVVVGDVVHWLCLTDGGSYMLQLHVGAAAAARVNVTSLPASFPRDGRNTEYEYRRRYLLATATAGGNPVVLVADADRISAWEQSKHTKLWKPRPQVVVEKEAILGFKAELVEKERMWWMRKHVPELLCFGERSGAVLLRIYDHCLLWLDLHSKKIVRCFVSSDRRMCAGGVEVYCPYEVHLSSWVPTFSSRAVTL